MSFTRQILVVFCLLTTIIAAGCASQPAQRASASSGISADEGVQIGDLADMPALLPYRVEGYGIVAGLGENGSSECPLDVLSYLKRYTRVMMPASRDNPEQLILSKDTAVVKVTGLINPGTPKGGRFDVIVRPIEGSQTRSLAGGVLYTTELTAPGKALAGGEVFAVAAGPVFIDTLADKPDVRTGRVLGGGSSSTEYKLFLALKKPDFKMASAIRNRILQRFGPGTAVTESDKMIVLTPPKGFGGTCSQFVALVRGLYVFESDELNTRRTEILISRLKQVNEADNAEASLIGLGRSASEQVRQLLNSDDPLIRLRAARVLLHYKESDALPVLKAILSDTASPLRMESLRAIADFSSADLTCGILSAFVSDEDLAIRLAATDELVRCGSPLVTRENVGGKFFVDIVDSPRNPMIYVARSSVPRIVLFGRKLRFEGDVFLTAADDALTVNADLDSLNVTVIRQKRGGTGVIGKPLISSRLVADVIKTLSASPQVEGEKIKLTGLDVPYSDTLDVLNLACRKGFIKARFVPGDAEKAEGMEK